MEEEFVPNPLLKVPKPIFILRILSKNNREYKSMEEIYDLFPDGGGTTRKILFDFKKMGIIEKIDDGSFFGSRKKGVCYRLNKKVARKYFRDTAYAELGRELGLGDIFA